MQPTDFWMVRAGDNNELADLVEQNNAVAVGGAEMGDLTALETRGEFRKRYKEVYPDQPGSVVAIKSGGLMRFAHMREGAYILTYLEATEELLIGLAEGPYEYRTDLFGEKYPHVRRVRWLKRVPLDAFGPEVRDAMTSDLTVFGLEDYGAEIHRLATAAAGG